MEVPTKQTVMRRLCWEKQYRRVGQSRLEPNGEGREGRSQLEKQKLTSLCQILGLDTLRKCIKVLLKMRNNAIKSTIVNVHNTCKRAGWEDLKQIEAWSQHMGYITGDSLYNYSYLSLQQHCSKCSRSTMWKSLT